MVRLVVGHIDRGTLQAEAEATDRPTDDRIVLLLSNVFVMDCQCRDV